MKKILVLLVLVSNLNYGQTKSSSAKILQNASSIPSLDELAGEWRPSWQDEQTPAISNFHGSMQAGRNVLSIVNLTQPPLSQGRYFDDGAIMELYVNGKPVNSDASKWFP